MPSTYITYPMGGRILPVERHRVGLAPQVVELDARYLQAFGWMLVPTHLWRAMRRNAAWIEPTLMSEWARLMREYAKNNTYCCDEMVRPGKGRVAGAQDCGLHRELS